MQLGCIKRGLGKFDATKLRQRSLFMNLPIRISSDSIGMISSSLCIVHCLATPFLFVFKATCNLSCHSAPLWWRSVDVLFLAISLMAVIYSYRNSSRQWVKGLLVTSWVFLLLTEISKFYIHSELVHFLLYIPATSLILTHFYNKKYCCSSKCC